MVAFSIFFFEQFGLAVCESRKDVVRSRRELFVLAAAAGSGQLTLEQLADGGHSEHGLEAPGTRCSGDNTVLPAQLRESEHSHPI